MARIVQYPVSHKLRESFLEQHTLFGNVSPARERRDAHWARVGLVICVILASFATFAELWFIILLVYDLFR